MYCHLEQPFSMSVFLFPLSPYKVAFTKVPNKAVPRCFTSLFSVTLWLYTATHEIHEAKPWGSLIVYRGTKHNTDTAARDPAKAIPRQGDQRTGAETETSVDSGALPCLAALPGRVIRAN